MRKVLIIARYFGTRVPGLIKYLPEFSFQPILLTAHTSSDIQLPSDLWTIETEYREAMHSWKRILGLRAGGDLRSQVKNRIGATSRKSFIDRVLTLGGEVINYPDSYKGWKTTAIKAANELLRQEDISIIISSSSPVTSHIIARELKIEHGIPWVADLRDLWSQNHNYIYSPVRKWFDRRLENKNLSAADVLVTVSQPWAEKLVKHYRGKAVHTITNGFDPENSDLSTIKLTNKFSITHTGNIYGGKQDPTKILAVVNNLITEGTMNKNDVEIRFYGPSLGWLDKEIRKYKLTTIVKQYGTVPHDDAIEKQGESQLLLLLDWDPQGEMGVYPLKVFEYLGAGRPILATGGITGNVIGKLLERTKAGIHAPDIESTKKALTDMYLEYKQQGRISFHGLNEEINRYSQREMTGEFARIFNKLISK